MVTRTGACRDANRPLLHYETKVLGRIAPSPALLVKGLATHDRCDPVLGDDVDLRFSLRFLRTLVSVEVLQREQDIQNQQRRDHEGRYSGKQVNFS
jgi:hypothetical protein